MGHFFTVNYLFASYLQTQEAGGHRIQRVEKIRPGKARFYFDISPQEAESLQIKFHNSAAAEFEAIRKKTVDLAF